MAYINRRQFLTRSTAAGFAASLTGITAATASRAWAADTSGYKAIVCILLNGGLDHADAILPYDQSSWNELRSHRSGLFGAYNADSSNSSRNIASLSQLNADNIGDYGGRQFGVPPELAPLQSMFADGDLAVVGNVGPLLTPVTRVDVDAGSANLPDRLFSHNDQQSTWMTLGSEGTKFGWGGLFVDAMIASSPGESSVFKAISTGSNFPFLSGDQSQPIRVTSDGAAEPNLLTVNNYLGTSSEDSATRDALRQYFETRDFGLENLYERDINRATGRGVENSRLIKSAIDEAPPVTANFPTSPFGKQLLAIAKTISIQSALNTSRQVFFVNVGGYDTHSNQSDELPDLLADVSSSLAAFRDALVGSGYWDNTVVFTASDFGRTVIGNGDGTDHGWGGHQFVMGGPVRGRRLYGDIPSPEIGQDVYTANRARLIPTLAIEQYAATIGSWFGLTNGELDQIFPNLGSFNSRDLGFLNA